MRTHFSFSKILRGRASLLLLIFLAACSTLPDYREILLTDNSPPTRISVRDAGGELSSEQTRELFTGLEKQANLAPGSLIRYLEVPKSASKPYFSTGNRVTLLTGRTVTFQTMLQEAGSAKDHVNMETFSFSDDPIGRQVAGVLTEKARAGVRINAMYDSAGSWGTPVRFFKELKRQGIRLLEFNPMDPIHTRYYWKPLRRNHVKLMVVDGRVALTGGINTSRSESKESGKLSPEKESADYWRDMDVKLEGPVVTDCQEEFLKMWASQGGPIVHDRNYFPVESNMGGDMVGLFRSYPGTGVHEIYPAYLKAIHNSTRSIYLTDGYFSPDDILVEELCRAARRGVDVKIIVPGLTNHPFVLYSGRFYYSRFLEAGVGIYERQTTPQHSKTAVIDGIWSTIGSSNLDMWSLLRNYELNTIIVGPDFTRQMKAQFDKDIAASKRLTLAEWKKRSERERFLERVSHLFNYWL